jgi:hypothetical protein
MRMPAQTYEAVLFSAAAAQAVDLVFDVERPKRE